MDIWAHAITYPLQSTVTSVHDGFTMALRSQRFKRSTSRPDNLQGRKANTKHYRQGGTTLLTNFVISVTTWSFWHTPDAKLAQNFQDLALLLKGVPCPRWQILYTVANIAFLIWTSSTCVANRNISKAVLNTYSTPYWAIWEKVDCQFFFSWEDIWENPQTNKP